MSPRWRIRIAAALLVGLTFGAVRAAAPNTLSSELRFTAPSKGASAMTLRRSGTDVELLLDGRLVRRARLERTSSISIAGADGATRDSLTVDLSHGPLGVPGGVHFDGGRGGYDSLSVTNGRSGDGASSYTATGAGRGRIRSASVRLDFRNLEPVSYAGPGTLEVTNDSPGATEWFVADDGVQNNGVSVIAGEAGFEKVTFGGFASVEMHGHTGNSDDIYVNPVDVADPDGGGPQEALSSLTIDVGAQDVNHMTAKNVTVRAIPPPLSVAVTGSDGNDRFNVGQFFPASLDTIEGQLTIDGGSNVGTGPAVMECGGNRRELTLPVPGDRLVVDDRADTDPHAYEISQSSFARDGVGLTYGDVEQIQFVTGKGDDSIAVASTPPSTVMGIENAGGGTLGTITTTGTNSVTLFSAGPTPNATSFTVDGTGSGSLSSLVGGEGNDALLLHANGTGSGVELTGGHGADTLTVETSSPGSLVSLQPSTALEPPDPNDRLVVLPDQQGTICTQGAPTHVELGGVAATWVGHGARIRWRTSSELNLASFNVYRRGALGRRIRLNTKPILARARGTARGARYELADPHAVRGKTYRFTVEAVHLDGTRTSRTVTLGSR